MKVRKIAITRQIVISMVVLLMVGNGVLAGIMTSRLESMLFSEVRQKALDVSSAAAASVDGEKFKLIAPGSEGTEEYEEIYSTLSMFRDSTDAMYVYSNRLNEAGEVEFVIDTDPDDPGEIGEAYDSYPALMLALGGTATVDDEPTVDEWGTFITGFAPIYSGNEVVGVVGIDFSYSEVLATQKKVRMNIIGICAVIFVVLFVILIIITGKLKKGFNVLNDKIAELEDGSGDLSKEITIHSGDEFEVIGGTINAFIKQIRSLVQQVATVSVDNAKLSTKINDSVIEVSANMEECSATSENVSENLDRTARDVESLAGKVGDVEVFVTKANQKALESSEYAIAQREKAIERIDEIKGNMTDALDKAGAVREISNIAEQIQSIATQTRLLSLNAQLEAARAGEAGKGFSVVATEVEALSDKISEAVKEIDSINENVLCAMDNLTEHVEGVTAFMGDEVSKDYNAFAELGKEYGDSTNSIRENMVFLKKQSDDINLAVLQIDKAIGDISKAVTDSAEKIELLSGASGDVSQSMDGLLQIPILKMEMKSISK